MTTVQETSTRRERTIIYAVITAVLVALVIIGLVAWRSAKSTREAENKADQLIAALNTAQAPIPARDQVIRLLGDDGGAICADPNAALSRAALLAGLVNGSGGPGTRPVIAGDRVIQGELLILTIYCPDQVPEFEQFVTSLETGG